MGYQYTRMKRKQQGDSVNKISIADPLIVVQKAGNADTHVLELLQRQAGTC